MINQIEQLSIIFHKTAAKDVFPREWPGPYGIIRPNYDLGEGPYSQNNGLPLGGESVQEFIKKKRKKNRKNVNKKR